MLPVGVLAYARTVPLPVRKEAFKPTAVGIAAEPPPVPATVAPAALVPADGALMPGAPVYPNALPMAAPGIPVPGIGPIAVRLGEPDIVR